jgi:hypothetical protein
MLRMLARKADSNMQRRSDSKEPEAELLGVALASSWFSGLTIIQRAIGTTNRSFIDQRSFTGEVHNPKPLIRRNPASSTTQKNSPSCRPHFPSAQSAQSAVPPRPSPPSLPPLPSASLGAPARRGNRKPARCRDSISPRGDGISCGPPLDTSESREIDGLK